MMEVSVCEGDFKKYCKFVQDEQEDSDELYVKAYLLYLVKKHVLRTCPLFSQCTTESVSFSFQSHMLWSELKLGVQKL